MKKFLYLFLFCFLTFSCTESPENVQIVDALPEIFPDYEGVTVPAGIAPLNFNVKNSEKVYVEITGRMD